MAGPPEMRNAGTHPKLYFVDEAGDGTLFNARGQVLIGTEGCSNFFIVGLLDVPDPEPLQRELAELRNELNADPLLQGIRQMDPARRQTAIFFHAKDDPVEVRREVFRVLARHDVKFSAVVKSKWHVLAYVRDRNRVEPRYRYGSNELYDFILRRLFKERLHKHQAYRVTFAIRGNRERSGEFRRALVTARDRFIREHHLGPDTTPDIEVVPGRPETEACLQAVDYFLWAVQRVFERRDEPGCDRYIRAVWERVRLIVDVDDTRRTKYGEYYTRKKPLVAAALQDVGEYRRG